MSNKTDYISWKAAAQAIISSEADAVAFQETNLAWTKTHRRRVQQILQQPTGNAAIATSSSADISTSPHQRGGTLQAIIGDWTSRMVQIGQDTSGLGRWSYVEMQGKEDHRYIILSGYRVCKNQTIDPGSNNTFNQQYRLLHQQGNRNPDPRAQFVEDLITTIKQWRGQGKAVLICIDANENPQNQGNTGIGRIFYETDLIDLHSARHPGQNRPPTYNRGSKPIDVCAGSPEFAEALQTAWYLPFGEPLGLHGDHRTLGLDFNIEKLFRQMSTKVMPSPKRGVNSNNTKVVNTFCQAVLTECKKGGLYERIHSLTNQTQLTSEQHALLDAIDKDLTDIFINADQQCTKPGHHPWSPDLHEAYLVHHYWTLKWSTKRTGRNYPQAFAKIEARVPHNKLNPPHLRTISANIRDSRKKLKAIHKAALDKRQAHLDNLIKAAHICKDTKRKKLIFCLKRAEELKRCYSLVRSVTKPRQQGGLSHVRVPTNQPAENTQWTSVYDPQQIEDLVLDQHRKHFSQAHGTIFTQEPLCTLINDNCTSEYAQQILSGTAQIDDLPIDEHTKDLLHHLKAKTSPSEQTHHPLDPDLIIQGFKKWPERTTTSPSGRHLGIYKALAKHFPPPKDETKTNEPKDNHPLQSGNDVLKLIIWMMQLAVTHTHTYDRWKTIWTLLLEKEAGNPKIDRLRTIHLYEADYNLLLKWFSSQGFILHSEQAQRINDSQGGGCPGRSAIDLAITKVLSYEIAETLRLQVIIVDNDAKACFDRMLEAPNNLACLQHGADPQYIKLHAQTQRELRYHLKHKYGISKGFNTHSETQPWHGMGQGAGDASNRWVIGSDSMADAYQAKAHGWTIKSPVSTESVKFTLKAFIDDVNLFIGQDPNVTDADFHEQAQQDINRWHGILKATGGELNTKKCFWSDFQLQYDPKGHPSIRPKQPDDPKLVLTTSDGTQETLKNTLSNEGIRHLGVHISMDGNQTTEEKMLYKRCRLFQKVYRTCPLTRHEAAVTYTTIFLPTITYPFPATTISQKNLNKAQSLTTPLVLSSMGYNRNMPKAVVYAPTSHGGIGFCHLHSEQGLQKVLQIMKHLRTRTSLGTTIELAIKAHQIHSGAASPILEYTDPISWMSDRWITNVRSFLHSVQSKIRLASPWTIPTIRQNDLHLMNALNDGRYSNSELQVLNHCRMALQVTTLAEIVDHTGQRLLQDALLIGTTLPNLTQTSKSKYTWPQQPFPSKTAWSFWTKAIRTTFTKPGLPNQLKNPLGPWKPEASISRTWYTTFNATTNTLYRHIPEQPAQQYILHQTTRHHHFYRQPEPTIHNPTNRPATIERQKQGFRISQPVLPIPNGVQPPPSTQPPTLNKKIRQLLPGYAPQLWAQFQPHPDHPPEHLVQYITQDQGQVIVVTNASLNAQNFSAFSWTIATTTQNLWTGDGTAPGTRRDAHSGRAEGYGLLSALTFLEKFLTATNYTNDNNNRTINGYCDNLGLIQQVTAMQNQSIPQPSQAISNDYDLVNEIYQTIRKIPIPIQLYHVKGHQDQDTPIQELPYPAQLNIECDKRARIALDTLPINISPHPLLPSAYPHLQIRNQTIVRQITEYLREAANLPAYYLYLTNKFHWDPHTTPTIEWRVIEFAMRKLSPPDRIRIRKIIHEWTPTRVSPGNNPSHEADKLCPSCHRTPETPEHLVRCDTPSRRKIRQKFHLTFSTLCLKNNIDPHLSQMWWIGMIQTTKNDHSADLYPAEFQPIFHSQKRIGWKQLYYGRISKQWTHYLSMNQPDLDPIQFLAKLIHQVWMYVLELWSSRNLDQENDTDRFPSNMLTDLQGIYAARNRLPPNIQDTIYNHTEEELLLKPKAYIQKWIINNKKSIRNELKILDRQARLETQDIRQFFPPR